MRVQFGLASFRRFTAPLWLLGCLLVCRQSEAAERRIALVIGNGAYQSVSPLPNSANDARLMAKTLGDLGFKLVGGGPQLNLDKPAMEKAIQDFGRQIVSADVGLFYYAGHGVQVRGSNYLVPITANLTRENDVDFQMIDAQLVLRQMGDNGAKLNIVLLDACRNNPFAVTGLRAAGGGLAQMGAPEGTIISYATQPGAVAQDGSDGDSPYTKSLAAAMREPGRTVFDVFNNVGLMVKTSTRGSQQPWVSSSPIQGQFFFVPPVQAPPPASDSGEQLYWQSVGSSNSVAELSSYLQRYPNGTFADLARVRIASLQSTKPPPPPPQQVAIATPQPAATTRTTSTTRFDGLYSGSMASLTRCAGLAATRPMDIKIIDGAFTWTELVDNQNMTKVIPLDSNGSFDVDIATVHLSGGISGTTLEVKYGTNACLQRGLLARK